MGNESEMNVNRLLEAVLGANLHELVVFFRLIMKTKGLCGKGKVKLR